MSTFISLNFARTKKELEAKLEEVRILSQKTLQQELERVRLEKEKECKSRELEEARKLQLSMLPEEIPHTG